MSVALEELVQALTLLQQASALDVSGENEMAIEMYNAAMEELDTVAPYLPPEHADVVRRNTGEIKRRIDLIKRDQWIQERRSEFPTFPVEYVPQPVPVEEFRVPVDPTFRVLWLMRLLQRSMRQGAFLAPDLFVGKDVWYQNGGGAALKHTGPKIRYFASLCEALELLRAVENLGNVEAATKSLQKYFKTAEESTVTLETDMGIRGEGTSSRSKLERGVRGLFHKGQQVLRTWMNQESNIELFIVWAVNTLEQAQLFEKWIIFYSHLPNTPAVVGILELLHRIVALLYTGLCSFLLRDMAILVERHQEKCRKSATRLLPVTVKLDGASS
ncbi:putative 40S ribosomal protein S33 [Trypanosoma theileri]|uniref:Putative 40S ribosomal protein S33 n=1 Tax=Trypanosoma theileri TaxID=67003 RepID=A0A1X0NS29_9TRYP|nr:putative 40S ribosomal protein S33 [Trypanosoma theileri]ORC87504.1 putative 40S ribosomal protein S33 [Trypanosoma theileri]